MKKRSLFVSVALLLVAILACTSATYAWFTSNANAKVNNITAAVDQRSSLLISSDTTAVATDSAKWKNSIDFGTDTFTKKITDGKLTDLSSVKGQEFFSKEVKEDNSVTYKAETTGFIEFHVSFLSSAGGTLYLSNGSFTGSSAVDEAARVAFITDDTKLIWEPSITTSALGAVDEDSTLGYAKTSTGGALKAVSAADGTLAPQMTTQNTISSTTTTIDTLTANEPLDVVIRIWLEGQDCSCVNSITNIDDVLCSLTFGVA